MLMRLELPHSYEVTPVTEAPAGVSPLSFRCRPSQSNEAVGELLLQFTPQNSPPWIGSFACRSNETSSLSVAISSPDPQIAFVIAGGEGYSVQVDSPAQWQPLPVSPVMFAELIPEQSLVVLGSGNAMAVYDPKGLVWFRRVVENELKLSSICEGLIHFSGLDTASGKTVSLSAVLRNGKELE
jgi:hypothetical protein